MADREIREPVRRPWAWVAMAGLVLVSIPWYLPPGSVAFVWYGIPMWMVISIVGTLALCGLVSWMCFTQWDVVGTEEEEAARAAADPADADGDAIDAEPDHG